MALKDVLANAPDNNWANDLEALGKYPGLSNKESETLFKAFRKAVPNNDSKSSLNLAAVVAKSGQNLGQIWGQAQT